LSSLTASLAAGRRAPIESRAAAAGIGLAFAAGAAVAASAGSGGSALSAPTFASVARGTFVVAWACVGFYTWRRRPDSRLGLLIAAAGLVYAAASIASYPDPAPHSLGRVVLAGYIVYLTYVLLCFPYDRLEPGPDRRFVRVFALTSLALWVPALLFLRQLPSGGALTSCAGTCPENTLRIATLPHAAGTAFAGVIVSFTALGLVLVAVAIARHAGSPNRLRWRAVGPVLAAAILLDVSYILFSVLHQANVSGAHPLGYLAAFTALAIPLSLLVGQIQGRTFAVTRLTRLVADAGTQPITPPVAQGLLRDALGDPTLELLLWSPERGRYLDVDGAPADLPPDRARRGVTKVGGHELLNAALVHDPSPSFDDGSGVVEGLALTALLLLDRKHLVDELRASRARILESAQEERVRLEHDIHDGVQQRLLALQMRAAEARRRAPPDLAPRLAEIQNDAVAALEELRVISRGLVAPALASGGVEAGLRSLALTLPIPLRVHGRDVGRYPASTEAAVYFCMVEAVQNSMKYAGAGAQVTISLRGEPDRLTFECVDDGVGFDVAAAAGSPGILGVRDRIEAVGGVLEIESSSAGTTVRGSVPVDMTKGSA
jgi:signal transduction histidine kinase